MSVRFVAVKQGRQQQHFLYAENVIHIWNLMSIKRMYVESHSSKAMAFQIINGNINNSQYIRRKIYAVRLCKGIIKNTK